MRDKQLQTRRGLQKILPLRLLCSYRTGKSAGERARSLARRRVETAIFLACDRWKLATTSVDSKKTYHRTSMLILEIRFGKVLTRAGSNGSADNNQRVNMKKSIINVMLSNIIPK